MESKLKDIPPDVNEVIKRVLLKRCTPRTAVMLLKELTGRDYSVSDVRNMKAKLMKQKFSYNSEEDNLYSTGEAIIQHLQKCPNVDFTFFDATVAQSTKLLTIRTTKKHGGVNATPEQKKTEKAKDLLALIKGLGLADGQHVLLAVAWTSHAQKRYVVPPRQ